VNGEPEGNTLFVADRVFIATNALGSRDAVFETAEDIAWLHSTKVWLDRTNENGLSIG
jgi:hypothetical protein